MNKQIWKSVNYLRHGELLEYDYKLVLPEPLASWDVFDYWEKESVRSIKNELNENDILFDVGAEFGWMSVAHAHHCKVFLIEPTKEFWANIYQIWNKNRTEQPVGCFSGLLGKETTMTEFPDFTKFPEESKGEMIDRARYQYVHSHSKNIGMMSLDDLVEKSGITPTALTIDVEGAELEVLKGGKKTLSDNKLKVWVSMHSNLAKRDYDITAEEIHDFMNKLGYSKVHLATDHEEHWLYTK